MRIIFLDIDGVICTNRSLNYAYARMFDIPFNSLTIDNYGLSPNIAEKIKRRRELNMSVPMFSTEYWPFDDVALYFIHKIVLNNPDIKFVISSSWRKGESVNSLDHKFRLKGLNIPILDLTGNSAMGNRGQEIKDWLDFNEETYGISKFCILDDCISDISDKFDNYVQTDYDFGFTRVEYEDVMRLLE